MGLGENLFKLSMVSEFFKQRKSSDTTIQDMVGEISGGKAWTAQYAGSCSEEVEVLSQKDVDPFSAGTREQ